jgi:hypothetical protein
MFSDLKDHLSRVLPNLQGEWVAKKSAYEHGLCYALEMKEEKGRYWDARWGEYRIEFKKGTSIWLDLVRYSEVFLQVTPEASQKTVCLFLVPDGQRKQIVEIICVDSSKIIQKLGLSEDIACFLRGLNKTVPRSLNAQASLTLSDVRQINTFLVK